MAACPLDPERDLGRHGTSETPFVALTSEMRGKVTIGAGEPAPRDGQQKSDGAAGWTRAKGGCGPDPGCHAMNRHRPDAPGLPRCPCECAPVVLLGTWIGLRCFDRIEDRGFQRVVLVFLLASGVALAL